MKREWTIIKDILSFKDNTKGLTLLTSNNLANYKYHIDKLHIRGTPIRLGTASELNDSFKNCMYLSNEEYNLLDCIYSDVFDEVVQSLEKHKVYGPLSLIV